MSPKGRRPGGQGARGAGRPKRRPASSTRWLARQARDPYVIEARRRGYRSRSAFKLAEIDDRFRILGPGRRVLDLGAAPGGWTQVAVERVRPAETGGRVVALDSAAMEPVPGARVVRGDVADADARRAAAEALGGAADAVLSDMSPPTTGHRPTDHLRVLALAEAALDVAEATLRPGGVFVVKLFQGGEDAAYLARVRRLFSSVRRVKPAASRKESRELYLVAADFRAREATPGEA